MLMSALVVAVTAGHNRLSRFGSCDGVVHDQLHPPPQQPPQPPPVVVQGALSRAFARYVAGADGPLNSCSSTAPTMVPKHVNTDQPALAQAMTTRQLPILPQASGDGCFGHNSCHVVMVFFVPTCIGAAFLVVSHIL